MCRGGEQEFCTVLLRCSSNPPPPVTQFYRVGLMGHAGSTSTGDRTLFGHPVPMFGFHVCCAREQLNRRAPATAHHTLIRQKLTQALLSLQSFRVYSQKKVFPRKKPSDEVYNRLHFSRATTTTAFIVSSFHNFCKAHSHTKLYRVQCYYYKIGKNTPDFFSLSRVYPVLNLWRHLDGLLCCYDLLLWMKWATWYNAATLICIQHCLRFPSFSLLLSIIAEKCFIKKVPHFRLSKLVA